MKLHQIFVNLGPENFQQQVRSISLGRLRTYQLFDRLKTRLHLHKLNQESLRKAAPKIWARIAEGDEEFAADLSQSILVSHLDMIIAVLNHLGVPHHDGFFDKGSDLKALLVDDWQQKAFDHFQQRFSPSVLLFYLNHLAHEADPEAPIFTSVPPPQ
jgi:hypothetical protein